jgi:hypothetical protein
MKNNKTSDIREAIDVVWTCSSNRGSANAARGIEMDTSRASVRGRPRLARNEDVTELMTEQGLPEEDTENRERWKLGAKNT